MFPSTETPRAPSGIRRTPHAAARAGRTCSTARRRRRGRRRRMAARTTVHRGSLATVTVEVAGLVGLAIGVRSALNAAVLRDEAVRSMHTIHVAHALHAHRAVRRTDGTVLRTGSPVPRAAGRA